MKMTNDIGLWCEEFLKEGKSPNSIILSKQYENIKESIYKSTKFLNNLSPPFKLRMICLAEGTSEIPKCEICGKSVSLFSANKNKFKRFCSKKCQNAFSDKSSTTKLNDKNWLYDKRISKQLSKEAIAEMVNLSTPTVEKWLRFHNIPDVKYNESNTLTSMKLKNKEWLFEQHKTLHLSCEEIAGNIGSTKSTVSVWLAKHNISANESNSYEQDKSCFLSKQEEELYQFVKELLPANEKILRNNRSLLNGRELDIYLPKRNLAFEYNGVYWHSEIAGRKDKKYHFNKTNDCINKGVKLYHIFSDDWLCGKKEIWKSKIRYLLHSEKIKSIFARKCVIKNISASMKNTFLEKCHLQGKDRAQIKFGLFHNDELVSVMTFCKSRFNKNYKWELSRYASALNCSVVGGFSKLLNHFIEEHKSKSIVSYADCSYSHGDVYCSQFSLLKKPSLPGYKYLNFKDSETRLNRQKFQKTAIQKNENLTFNPNITEWENMIANGYDRIWDAGQMTFAYNT